MVKNSSLILLFFIVFFYPQKAFTCTIGATEYDYYEGATISPGWGDGCTNYAGICSEQVKFMVVSTIIACDGGYPTVSQVSSVPAFVSPFATIPLFVVQAPTYPNCTKITSMAYSGITQTTTGSCSVDSVSQSCINSCGQSTVDYTPPDTGDYSSAYLFSYNISHYPFNYSAHEAYTPATLCINNPLIDSIKSVDLAFYNSYIAPACTKIKYDNCVDCAIHSTFTPSLPALDYTTDGWLYISGGMYGEEFYSSGFYHNAKQGISSFTYSFTNQCKARDLSLQAEAWIDVYTCYDDITLEDIYIYYIPSNQWDVTSWPPGGYDCPPGHSWWWGVMYWDSLSKTFSYTGDGFLSNQVTTVSQDGQFSYALNLASLVADSKDFCGKAKISLTYDYLEECITCYTISPTSQRWLVPLSVLQTDGTYLYCYKPHKYYRYDFNTTADIPGCGSQCAGFTLDYTVFYNSIPVLMSKFPFSFYSYLRNIFTSFASYTNSSLEFKLYLLPNLPITIPRSLVFNIRDLIYTIFVVLILRSKIKRYMGV